MIKSVTLKNFGPISDLAISDFGKINLLIGPNRTGKTILLKALYCAQKTIELTGRGKNPESGKDLLLKKLYWTFQVDKIGQLVRKPDSGPLEFYMTETGGEIFSFGFGSDTERKIVRFESTAKPRSSNSVFIPAKEVLTLLDVIKEWRYVNLEFAFDDTYSDLATALTPPTKGKVAKSFAQARAKLEKALDGRIAYSKEKKAWQYEQGKSTYDLNLTSEGTKKIAIFDTLIANHFLTKDSIVFIDEPESGLHPSLIVDLLDIIAELANYGVQFFIASHSYFVIKKLCLIAQKHRMSIPVISFDSAGNSFHDLIKGMPENPIIAESIKLYEEEISL